MSLQYKILSLCTAPTSMVGRGQFDFHHRNPLAFITAQFNSDSKNKAKLFTTQEKRTPLLLQPTPFFRPNKVTKFLSPLQNPRLFHLQGFGNYFLCFFTAAHWGRSLPALTQQSWAPPAPINSCPSWLHSSQHKQCNHCFVSFSTHNFRRQSSCTATGSGRAAGVPHPVPVSWRQRACCCGKWGDTQRTQMWHPPDTATAPPTASSRTSSASFAHLSLCPGRSCGAAQLLFLYLEGLILPAWLRSGKPGLGAAQPEVATQIVLSQPTEPRDSTQTHSLHFRVTCILPGIIFSCLLILGGPELAWENQSWKCEQRFTGWERTWPNFFLVQSTKVQPVALSL